MIDYFQRFKDLKAKEEKKLKIETKEPLINRIFFRNNSDIYLDNRKVFTLPTDEKPHRLRILEKENNSIIYAITPHHIYRLALEDEIMTLTHSAPLDVRVTDIHPAIHNDNSTVIVCGVNWPHPLYGVRLLDLNTNSNIKILTGDSDLDGDPVLTIDDKKIWLSALKVSSHPSSSVTGSVLTYIKCLNDYLTERGIDIEKTLQIWEPKNWRR